MSHSAIYEGTVFHDRTMPRRHRFSQRAYFLYIDLDELPRLFAKRWLWSVGRANVSWFRRADYLGDPDRSLKESVLELVRAELGHRPSGAVRMLTQVRTWGYVFNPVTFYYCFDTGGRLEAVAAEITNTPWRERHTYVLDARGLELDQALESRFTKTFHVSPFFGMKLEYEWRFAAPGDRLSVRMTNLDRGTPVFSAGMECQRRSLTGVNLMRVLVRYPFQPLRLHVAIYWQAALLYLKRMPFFPHPKLRPSNIGANET